MEFKGTNIANGNENSMIISPKKNEEEGITFINGRTKIEFPLSIDDCLEAYNAIMMRNSYFDYVMAIEHILP